MAALAAHAVLHLRAGWTLPVPWPDEVHFLMPAQSLAASGTLWVPGLHPERPLMWMPPGYATMMAAVFSITGPSLLVARGISMLAVWIAALALWRLAGSVAHRGLATIVAGLFLLHPAVVVIGNVARMDAVVLAMSLTAAACLDRRPVLAVGLLVLATLVHPNGAFFLVAAAVYILVGLRRGTLVLRPTRAELGVLVIAAVALCAYAMHAASHWPGLVQDMAFQVARKTDRDVWLSFTGRRMWMALALVAMLVWPQRRDGHARLLVVGLPAYLVQRLGHEMWYHPFDVLFTAVFAVAAVRMVVTVAPRLWTRARAATVLVVGAALSLLGLAIWPELPRHPHAAVWRHMRMADAPYVGPNELHSVAQTLSGRVQFLPRGDAAMFLGATQARFSIVDDVRHASNADMLVIHESSDHPRHWRRRTAEALALAQQEGRAQRIRTDPPSARWWRVHPLDADPLSTSSGRQQPNAK
ncbi:MAG: glycosyltransferase family 39 protein [Nannocystaceae bacterium]|nr:glycosyltransferase family 39 protein [Nannocystaceae bacterium]